MHPFESLDQESLMDALTEYYTKYRSILDVSWDEQEFNSCRDTLIGILGELNKRKGYSFQSEGLPRNFVFNRESDQG